MKKIALNLIVLSVIVTASIAIFSSCSDDNLSAATRLFRPVLSDDDIVTGLDADSSAYITLTWDNYSDANQYVVKIVASDGSDSATITTDSVECTFSNLEYVTEYNIYIHSANTETGLVSKDFTATTVTPDYPTELNSISTANIIDTQVRVTWSTTNSDNVSTVYDTLKVYNVADDSLISATPVTSDELEAGSMIIRNLSPETGYRVEAYNNGKFKGRKSFMTTASESYDGLVFDLRGMDDDSSYKYLSTGTANGATNVIDSIVQANPNQDITFVLQGGVTYRLPTLTLSTTTTGTLKFVTGLTLNGNANFAVSGNFDVASSVTIGGLNFEKVFFTEAPLEGKGKTSDSYYGSTYLFNLSGTGAEIKSVDFTNCSIKYKRGICRIKAANVIDTFTIDNCIIDSISGYGITNCDNASAKILTTNVSNSTFSNCDKLFVNTKCSTGTQVVKVANSTFVYCGTDKSYLFDYNGCTISSFAISYCLFGRPGTMTLGTLTNGVYGWRGNTSPNCSDCYYTSDCNWVVGTDGTLTNPISGTELDTDTPSTFESPTTSDFTIISSALKKLVIGDSRWY